MRHFKILKILNSKLNFEERERMKHFKILKILGVLLAVLPFVVCFGLPIALLNGDFRVAFKCVICRGMAVITEDYSNRLC